MIELIKSLLSKGGGVIKILGLSYGRKMENTEVLLREALMGAQEMGAGVSMIRLLDLNIKPCKGCITCVMGLGEGGSGDCIIKDDLRFLDDQIMECDGLILGTAVYVLGPPGLIKVIADRRGPARDAAFLLESKKIREGLGAKARGQGPDERAFKKRVAGFISVGGATTPHWLSFALPMMHFFTFPSNIQVVDQIQVMGTSRLEHLALDHESLARARKLGRNVAGSADKTMDELEWLGDEPGMCPVCHSNLLTVTGKNPVECPVCGIAGTLALDGDRITVDFSLEEQARSRLVMGGKKEHWDEIMGNAMKTMQRPDYAEMLEKTAQMKKKMESYDIPVISPK